MTGPAMLESQLVRPEIRASRIIGTSHGLAHSFITDLPAQSLMNA